MADLSIELLGSGAEPYIPPPPDQPSTFTGISTSEAIGNAIIAGPIILTGIETSEAIGAPIFPVPIVFDGLQSAETIGIAIVSGPIICEGLSSSENIGIAQVGLHVVLTGAPTAEASGNAIIAGPIILTGIETSEAIGSFGTEFQVSLSGLSSSEAIGTPTVYNVGEGFARVYSISHVRIRYRLEAQAPVSTAQWNSGHDPTRHELVHRPAGQRIRLGLIAQTAPITPDLPSDPGPYALTRDGIVERVMQQTTIVIPATVVTELPQGDVIQTKPDRKSAVRLRGSNGRFVSPKSTEGARITTTATKGATTVTLKPSAEGAMVQTGKAKVPTTVTTDSASGLRVRTNKPQNPSTPPTKPRGTRVRTKK